MAVVVVASAVVGIIRGGKKKLKSKYVSRTIFVVDVVVDMFSVVVVVVGFVVTMLR